MNYTWNTIRFFLDLQFENSSLPNIEKVKLHTSKSVLNADVYSPKRKALGTILTINGLAPLGNRDPRFIKLNKSLCNFGFKVVSPYYYDICNYHISSCNIRDIKESIKATTSNTILAPTGKVSILAPSFSGSLSLIASADSEIRPLLNSICSIGAYGNVETVINNLFSNQDLDEYGRMILLLNFLPLSIGENKELFSAIRFLILDNYFKEKDKLLQKFYTSMSDDNKVLFDSLRYNSKVRLDHWNRIIQNGGDNRKLLKELSVLGHLNEVDSPILIVHGNEDDVVPVSEADHLANELSKKQIDWKVCKTNLISHGDTGFSISNLLELPKLIQSFAFFFRHASN